MIPAETILMQEAEQRDRAADREASKQQADARRADLVKRINKVVEAPDLYVIGDVVGLLSECAAVLSGDAPTSRITVDLAVAMNQLVTPAIAPLMERDAAMIDELRAEVAHYKRREQDLLEANNRYLARARRAEDLFRVDPSAIEEAAIAAYEFDCRHGDDRPAWPKETNITQNYWKGVVKAILSMVCA